MEPMHALNAGARYWRLGALLCCVLLLSGSSCRGRSCNAVPNGCDPVSIGGTVSGLTGTLVLQLNGTDSLSISMNGPFVFSRKLAPDSTYSVVVLTQPVGQMCTITGGSGSVGLGVSDIAVNCQNVPAAALVVSSGSHIAAYAIDPYTGVLTALTRRSFAIDAAPQSVATHPSGNFTYEANFDSGDVSAYTIGPVTGALAPVPGSPFAAGSGPSAIAIHPSGAFLFVANELSYNVSAYAIDFVSGALTAVSGGPYPAGTTPVSIAIDPSGSFVFVANRASADISAFSIDGRTGALTPIAGSPFKIALGLEGPLTITASR